MAIRWLIPWGALVAISGCAAVSQSTRGSCDRTCLGQGLNRYLASLVGHDRALARLAPGFRATENGAEIRAGGGLWMTANSIGTVQNKYFDPVSSQAAFYGLIDESGTPAIVALRLKFKGADISESEAVITRKGERLYDVEGFIRNAPMPDSKPASRSDTSPVGRKELMAIAQHFFDSMQAHSSDGLVHTSTCVRLESGSGGRPATGASTAGAGTSSGGCTEGFERLLQIREVGHRRISFVDEVAGTVVATVMFLRPPGAMMPNGTLWKRNLVMDVFTTDKGLLSGIYGVTHYLDDAASETTGWPDGVTRP